MPTGDPNKLVVSGDRLVLPAVRHNRWQRAAGFVEAARQRTDQNTGSSSDPEGLVKVRNDSGNDVDRFAVLGVADVVVSPADNLPEFLYGYGLSGVTPTAADYAGKFVITYEPIANGKVGRAFAFGVCPVQVNVLAAGDRTADVTDGDCTQLTSGSGSVQILHSSGTGTQWCLVRFLGGSSLPPGNARMVLQVDDNGGWVADYVQAAV